MNEKKKRKKKKKKMMSQNLRGENLEMIKIKKKIKMKRRGKRKGKMIPKMKKKLKMTIIKKNMIQWRRKKLKMKMKNADHSQLPLKSVGDTGKKKK